MPPTPADPADDANALYEQAAALAEAGHFEDALPLLAAALKLAPGDSKLWHARGFIHMRLGRHQDALADFAAARDLRPSDARAVYHYGLALAQIGRAHV